MPTGGNGFALRDDVKLAKSPIDTLKFTIGTLAKKEVGYVLTAGQDLSTLEVKSGQNPGNVSGLEAFARQFPAARPLIVGTGGVSLEAWMQG